MTKLDSVLKKTRVKQPPHLVVGARAGTGKTTTLVEGLKILQGQTSPLTPSPQQQAVWDSICKSQQSVCCGECGGEGRTADGGTCPHCGGTGKSQGFLGTACFVAFNKSIAAELKTRVPTGVAAMTMHSLGFNAVLRHFGIGGQDIVNQYRVQDIISELVGKDIRDLRRDKPDLVRATERLVGLCKINLLGFDHLLKEQNGIDLHDPKDINREFSALASHYDVELNGQQAEIFDLVPRVLERCKDVAADGCVDFNDMIWLPIALDLPVFQYDLLLVDEVQDLNRCQQALAMKASKRLILCGDDRQAIYGWAGADSDSIPRMMKQLSNTQWGCEYLPLTVTHRCGKAIVREAQKIVPDFEAHESNCEGRVSFATMKITQKNLPPEPLAHSQMNSWGTSNYRDLVQSKDMILCRVNAPLISECFKFLIAGHKANIQGRDVGKGLITTIRKLMRNFKAPLNFQAIRDNALVAAGLEPESDDDTPPEYSLELKGLLSRLSDWLHDETQKENAERNPSESRLIALQDKYDCILCFTEDQTTVDGVIEKIKGIFTDDKNGDGIKLSSVHKAKGLEARRVFILLPEESGMPHPMAKSKWQIDQEWNLKYVAITRAIEELIYVS